ncbi:MAG: hypothetical protein ABUS47_16315 [Steroidobacter sp.]
MKWWTLLLLLTFSVDAHASWSDWWLNQEQQAQRALDHGDAKQAAHMFSDPRRRAYAESKAGNYTDAAQQLAAFNDAQSQYNRGNALAYSGDLQNALSAYDVALKQTAADSALHRDAQHNRDLVAKQLQQKQNQSQNNKGNRNDQNQQNQQEKNDQQEKNSSGSSSDSSAGSSGSDRNQDNKNDIGNSSSANAGNSRQNDKQGQQSAGRSGQSSSSAGGTSSSASAQQDAQAQRDAQAAAARQNHGQSSSASSAQGMGMAQSSADDNTQHDQRAAVDTPIPPTEQSLAEQQWLRQIPDDPAGLVRRKFLIEHWLKQHGAQHEDSN